MRSSCLQVASPTVSFAVAYDDPRCGGAAEKGAGVAESIVVEVDAAVERDAEKDAVAEKNAAIEKGVVAEKDAAVVKDDVVEKSAAAERGVVTGTDAASGRVVEAESGVEVGRDAVVGRNVASGVGVVDVAEEPPGSVGAGSSEDQFAVYRQEAAWPTSELEHWVRAWPGRYPCVPAPLPMQSSGHDATQRLMVEERTI